jgi:hypothetical protein
MRRRTVLAAMVAWLLPAAALAQASIAGVVADESGAPLPGVRVEAASAILIERLRSVVTDTDGRYAIVELAPGEYRVTFRLDGFRTVTREPIELTGSFVAEVNAALPVGGVAETVTVTSDAPVVDVRSTRLQTSITADLFAAIPTGRSLVNLGVLIPGMGPWSARTQNDVGGTNNLQNVFMAIHGGRVADERVYVDGVAIRNIQTEGYTTNFTPDMSSTREVTIDHAAGSAEQLTGGVRVNYVPRDGGNRFQLSAFATGANASFQAKNVTSMLRQRGLMQPDALKATYDVNPSGGGPVVKNRIWFYTAARSQSNQNYVGGVFENRNAGDPNAWSYEPDFSRQGLFAIWQTSANGRVTVQPAAKQKIGLFFERQWRTWDEGNVNRSPEAFSRFRFPRNQLAIVSWSSPLSDRWLLEARASYHGEAFRNIGADALLPNNRSLIPVLEQGGAYPGLMYRAKNGPYSDQWMPFIKVAQASVSHVSGAHAVKAGFARLSGADSNPNTFNDSGLQYRFNNGVPNQITEFATPYELGWTVNESSLFAQDSWALRRLTLNGGLRFDYYGTTFPAAHLAPAPLVPSRDLDLPETPWYRLTDLSPRVGAAYDLTGDGKTALRASAGRYVVGLSPMTGNPTNALALSVTRSWSDADRDFAPDCDILNPRANGECGMISDLRFGGATPSTTYDPAILAGWNVRPVDWEFSAGVQREVRPRVSLTAAYIRRVYGNFTVQDNRATSASDYSPFSVTAPIDPRLPGGGGYPVGGLYDLDPSKRGQVDNYVTAAARYGRQIEHWTGADLTLSIRLPGLTVQGGVSGGRTASDTCEIARQLPETLGALGSGVGVRQTAFSLDQCGVDTAFLTQTKWMGSYTIPRIGVQLAGTFQSSAGVEIQANYVAPNAVVQPSLGRPLSGGAANTTVTLLNPGTRYGDRLNQLDLRVAKVWPFAGGRAAMNVDLYNALNSSAVTALNQNYSGTGAAWLQPQALLAARLLKLSVQIEY